MTDSNVLKIRLSLKGRPIKTYTFTKETITLGRDPASDIHLNNVNVSREHLRFELSPTGYYSVEDLGSANGTFLNDERLSHRDYVYNNDVIRVGKYTLWIAFEKDRRAESATPPRVSPEVFQGTTVLSSADLEKMLASSRQSDGKGPLLEPAASPEMGSRPPAARSRRRPVVTGVIVALAFLLGTAVGAGATWLLVR